VWRVALLPCGSSSAARRGGGWGRRASTRVRGCTSGRGCRARGPWRDSDRHSPELRVGRSGSVRAGSRGARRTPQHRARIVFAGPERGSCRDSQHATHASECCSGRATHRPCAPTARVILAHGRVCTGSAFPSPTRRRWGRPHAS
jgi:hypothetical protein